MKLRAKRNQISVKNQPQTDPRRGTPSAWGCLEGLLGALGRLFCIEFYFRPLKSLFLEGLGCVLGRAVLGPKMDQGSPKLSPKTNTIGVLWRLEGPLERPRSVLGASRCVSKQLPALHTKKDKNLTQFWCPRT